MANVPRVPGVPPLSSYAANAAVILAVDLVSFLFQSAPVWGVFLKGLPAFAWNSTATFEYKQDWAIGTYPVEGGSFQSYDKVQLPFDVRVKVTSGGSEFERQALINSVDAAANSLDLYDVVTPERIYRNCNVSHYDYRRTAVNGVGMIVMDIWFQQIRPVANYTLSNTAQPTVAGQQGVGSVQPQTPPSSISQGIASEGGPF